MTATTNAAVVEQREALVDKIDDEVGRKVNLDDRLLHYHRAILQDLPFNGIPELLTDEHRAAVDRLVEKHGRRNLRIRVKRIVGYASKVGDDADQPAVVRAACAGRASVPAEQGRRGRYRSR